MTWLLVPVFVFPIYVVRVEAPRPVAHPLPTPTLLRT